MTNVALINHSTVLASTDLAPILGALQTQVTRDFAPAWGQSAQLQLATWAVPGAWSLLLLDDADQARSLGYHQVDQLNGLPLGKVFVRTTQQANLNWTVTTSHELLEMLGDPDTRHIVRWGPYYYAYEACDPVEADQFGYEINGVRVSNFILPTWFNGRPGARYDFLAYLRYPRQLLPGGYVSVFVPGRGWTQQTARETPEITTRPGTSGRSATRQAHEPVLELEPVHA